MEWDRIDIKAILRLLRNMEEVSLTIGGENSVVYSDSNEELKITYRRLK